MRLVAAHARLRQTGATVWHTTDAAALLNIRHDHASQLLTRLARAGLLVKLRRGVWSDPDRITPLALPGLLTAPFPSYVSLQTALYHHGMIAQIPKVIYAATIGRTRRYETPRGTVSVHHLQPAFFFGFEPLGDQSASLATPEKALVDLLYLGPARSRLFCALPELELPRQFKISDARRIIQRIPSAKRRTLVSRRFEELLATVRRLR
jgi:predicted transcriptional regulator of viral defense system